MISISSYIERIIIKSALLAFLFCYTASAQPSIIVNGTFEDSLSTIPFKGCNTKMATNYYITKGWYQVGGSADFYNSDESKTVRNLSIHKARTGQGRAALVLGQDPARTNNGYREFIQTKLKEPMEPGALYSVNFYVVKDDRSVFCAPEVGAYFSDRNVVTSGYAFPQVTASVKTTNHNELSSTTEWKLVHGYYRAHGGEKYMTIGNFGDAVPDLMQGESIPGKLFRNDLGWYAYYYIDDVVVYEVGDSLFDDPDKMIPQSEYDKPFNNLVFVLDVSSSMKKNDKIKRLKSAVDQFLGSLNSNELISIVTFDASPRILARAVPCKELQKITHRIDSLETGGGTNVNAAIAKAYDLVDSAFIAGGNNRVILVTDAPYQISNHTKTMIEQHSSEKNVAFSTLLFDAKPDHALKKLCRSNKGTCSKVDDSNNTTAFKSQSRERKVKWYGPGRKKKYTYFTVRLLLVALIALLIWAKAK